jgi:multiple sugar transport system ATP-binding protein
MIAGLEEASAGEILMDGTRINNVPPKDRDMSMVFQNYALYPHMTVAENIGFGLKMRKIPKLQAAKLVTEAAEMLGISNLLKRRPHALSGGERQRVALGRAIVRRPKVFLFDEPLSNVDALVRVQTRVVIKRLLSRFGITSLYVTHDQTEAVALGDRLAVMREGRVEQVGTYAQLTERPENLFVAGFLGLEPMSFFTGSKEGVQLRLPGGEAIRLPEHFADLAPDGERLTLGVRARDVWLGEAGAESSLRGLVEVVEVLPSERHNLVHLQVAGTPCDAQAARELSLAPGAVVGVTLNFQHIYLFYEASGLRLWPK